MLAALKRANYRFRYTDLPQALKADPHATVMLPKTASRD
jgi:hypothetical protein